MKKFFWYSFLTIAGLALVNYEINGLAKILPLEFAITLAVLIGAFYGVSCHLAKATGKGKTVFLAYSLLGVASIMFGLSFNEHMKHGDGQRMEMVRAESSATVNQNRLQEAKADLEEITNEVDKLIAEVAAMKQAHDRTAILSDEEVRRLEKGKMEIDDYQETMDREEFHPVNPGKGQKWEEAKAERDRLITMFGTSKAIQGQLDSHHAAVDEREMLLQDIAAREALIQRKESEIERATESVVKWSNTVDSAIASVDEVGGGMYFLYSLASRWSLAQSEEWGPDIAQVLMVALGSILGFFCQASFGYFCTVGVVSHKERKAAAAAIAETGSGNDGEPEEADNVITVNFPDPEETASFGQMEEKHEPGLGHMIMLDSKRGRSIEKAMLDAIPECDREFMLVIDSRVNNHLARDILRYLRPKGYLGKGKDMPSFEDLRELNNAQRRQKLKEVINGTAIGQDEKAAA